VRRLGSADGTIRPLGRRTGGGVDAGAPRCGRRDAGWCARQQPRSGLDRRRRPDGGGHSTGYRTRWVCWRASGGGQWGDLPGPDRPAQPPAVQHPAAVDRTHPDHAMDLPCPMAPPSPQLPSQDQRPRGAARQGRRAGAAALCGDPRDHRWHHRHPGQPQRHPAARRGPGPQHRLRTVGHHPGLHPGLHPGRQQPQPAGHLQDCRGAGPGVHLPPLRGQRPSPAGGIHPWWRGWGWCTGC
jgi:hypothetical protein